MKIFQNNISSGLKLGVLKTCKESVLFIALALDPHNNMHTDKHFFNNFFWAKVTSRIPIFRLQTQ